MNRGHNGANLPIATMIDREGKKEKQTKVAMAHIFLSQRQQTKKERKKKESRWQWHTPSYCNDDI
jgi:hypothetical protein